MNAKRVKDFLMKKGNWNSGRTINVTIEVIRLGIGWLHLHRNKSSDQRVLL